MQASQLKRLISRQSNDMHPARSLEIFQERLLDLSHHLSLPELAPNEFNVCSLVVDDDHWIHISYSAEDMQIHWTSAMASSAFKNTQSLFSTLLAANLSWQLMQGGFFAVDEITGVVLYRFHEPVSNLHTQRFLETTERFIERSRFWKKQLQLAVDDLPTTCSEDSTQNIKPGDNHSYSHLPR